MTSTLTECPTCHEHIPFVWHGHHAVSSGHPEDDQPWCKHCGRPLDDMRSDNPADYCTKASVENRRQVRRAVSMLKEPNHGWTDEELAADDARTHARAHADDPQPETGSPFARAEQTFLP